MMDNPSHCMCAKLLTNPKTSLIVASVIILPIMLYFYAWSDSNDITARLLLLGPIALSNYHLCHPIKSGDVLAEPGVSRNKLPIIIVVMNQGESGELPVSSCQVSNQCFDAGLLSEWRQLQVGLGTNTDKNRSMVTDQICVIPFKAHMWAQLENSFCKEW